MIATKAPPPLLTAWLADFAGSYRLSIDQYHALIEHAILTTDDKVELIGGHVLFKLDHVTLPPPGRFYPRWQQLRRWTLAEYRRMVELGILTPNDKLELIDGHLVAKMSQNPRHRLSVVRVYSRLPAYLPAGWWVSSQCPVEVGGAEPEPDGAVIRGRDIDYATRQPTAADCGLVIEVSDTSLRDDRRVKCVLYGEASIPTYWIVNVDDRFVEVYTRPTGASATPGYATRTDFTPGQSIPLTLDGDVVASIPVDDLLP